MKTPEEMQEHERKMGLSGQAAKFSAGEKSEKGRIVFNTSGGGIRPPKSEKPSRSEWTANREMAAEAEERAHIARVLGPQGNKR